MTITWGWISLLTVDSPRWHDAVRLTASAEPYSELMREASVKEFGEPEATIDYLIVAYLAPQHARIEAEARLSEALSEIAASVGTVLLCAVDRNPRGVRITPDSVNELLVTQAGSFGNERFGYRHSSADALAADVEQHLASLTRSSPSANSLDESIDPALNPQYNAPYKGMFV